jgi:serine protease AprX
MLIENIVRKIVFIILVFTAMTGAQTKFYIFLKDKTVEQSSKLNKTGALYKQAEKELTLEAIERRKLVMGDDYITFEDLPMNNNYIQRIEALSIKIENKLDWFNAVTSYLNDEQVIEIKKLSFVQKVEPVRLGQIQRQESDYNDPFTDSNNYEITRSNFSFDYGQSLTQLALSDVPTVHDLQISGENVYIGILDNGFNWKTHRALSSRNVIKEYDYIQKDNDVSNNHFHGTAVFSILGGYEPGQIIGPAYNAKFFLARTEVDGSENRIEEDNYAAALQDMEKAGVQITSSSVGYNLFDNSDENHLYSDMNGSTTVCARAVNLAFQRGVFLVNSAGNEGNDKWQYIITPADAFNIIAVGAVDRNNSVASFSSRGPTFDGRIKPEICAMGVSDFYAIPNNAYGTGSGTSFSAPIVAGIAGLLKSVYPHLNNTQMRQMFLESGDNAALPNNDRGYGLLSASKLISYPNLKKEGTQYRLCKIFINKEGINSSSIKLNLRINEENFQTFSMNFDGSLKYDYLFPSIANRSSVEFYFTYNTKSGSSAREPVMGNFKFSYGNLLVNNLTNIEDFNITPAEYVLFQNYPNPFNPESIIKYYLPDERIVTLKLFDVLGREVATLVNEFQIAGEYHFVFSNRKFRFASGVYFYQIIAGDFRDTKKMIILK